MAEAACHVVTATGSGTNSGADWNNAYNKLPTTLIRGDTYYLADGTYGQWNFATAESGTTRITVKKAIEFDNCTDTGWNLATMGSGQAIFNSGNFGTISVGTGYLTIDGQRRDSQTSGYGIKVDGTNTAGTFAWQVNAGGKTGVILRYIEVAGGGDSKNITQPDVLVRMLSSTTLLLEYCYLHDASNIPIQSGAGANGLTIQYCLIDKNKSTPTNHGDGLTDVANSSQGGSSNVVIRYNWWRNIEGTAFITSLNASSIGTADTWAIYGNIFSYTPGNTTGRAGVGNGVVACINGNTCSNWTISNNTIVNVGGGGATGNAAIQWPSPSVGTPTIINNLWYGNLLNVNFNLRPGTTENYNTFLNSAGSGGTGANDVRVVSGAPDPFTNSSGENYHLTSATTAGLTQSSSLPAGCTVGTNCFNIDPDLVVRGSDATWDRGAYEVGGGAPPVPGPPGTGGKAPTRRRR